MADSTCTFLVELGTEELPPKALAGLSAAFANSVAQQLSDLSLSYEALLPYATPRRLALRIDGLITHQADQQIERKGPPVKIAYDADGKPTKAAEKFAEGCGINVDDITTTKTDKGEWLFYQGTQAGSAAAELLPEVVQQALQKLPIPKRMRWGDSPIEFVRPVHWAVMLMDDQVIDAELMGMATGNTTYGHRFHAPDALILGHAQEYPARLKDEGWVIADANERKTLIDEMVQAAAKQCAGRVVADDSLLDEITALVEWPIPVAGQFDQRYLELPPEVLISTLKDHQRYYPVVTGEPAAPTILPWFITISNIKSTQPEEVKLGNERVVAPRLADAEFFWLNDRKKSLADRIPDLDAVVFQQKLGSLAAKVNRLSALTTSISALLSGDAEQAARAASICKCDLLTGMVGEFPDLQGVMGRYFALADNEASEVADAMAEQYLPRFSGDALPQTTTGQALALADRIDTLTAIFALGKKPSGTKDPFGLRRAALGTLRILIESELDLDLRALIHQSATQIMPLFKDDKKPAYSSANELTNAVFDYMQERLHGYFVDDASNDFDAGMFAAVAATDPVRPLDFYQRINAVHSFMQLEESTSLAAANKRIANILKSASEAIPPQADGAHLKEEAEKTLYEEVQTVAQKIEPLRAAREYQASLSELASLRSSVDTFFDSVMVMDDDHVLRSNRLALLSQIRALFLHTADFSRLQ